MSLVITALYLLRGSVKIVLPRSTIISTESASDEREEVTEGSCVRGDTCSTVRTTARVVVSRVYRDKVGFVHQMVQNKVTVLTLVYVIRSVLYSNVHRCTYAILCIVLVVLLLVRLIGPESKYSCPDPDRINIVVRTFTTRS
jgi:hypothetical protein